MDDVRDRGFSRPGGARIAVAVTCLLENCSDGRGPLMAAQCDGILKYIRGFQDVWIVRHDQPARWTLDNGIREWTNRDRSFKDTR